MKLTLHNAYRITQLPPLAMVIAIDSIQIPQAPRFVSQVEHDIDVLEHVVRMVRDRINALYQERDSTALICPNESHDHSEHIKRGSYVAEHDNS